jgi:hypothetical protein
VNCSAYWKILSKVTGKMLMIQATSNGPGDNSQVSWTGEPTSRPKPEEGLRLIHAFLKISSPRLREALIKFVEDLAKLEEAKKS